MRIKMCVIKIPMTLCSKKAGIVFGLVLFLIILFSCLKHGRSRGVDDARGQGRAAHFSTSKAQSHAIRHHDPKGHNNHAYLKDVVSTRQYPKNLVTNSLQAQNHKGDFTLNKTVQADSTHTTDAVQQYTTIADFTNEVYSATRLETLTIQNFTSHVTYVSLKDMMNHVTNPNYRFANYSHSITEDDIENFESTLPPLLENYRSPCWLEYLSSENMYDDSYYLKKDCMERDAIIKSFSWSDVTYKRRLHQGARWRMRCMPQFYLLGMPKSGSTDLFVSMVRNMQDVISGARKEPHFWNRRRFGITYSGSCRNIPRVAGAQLKDYLDLNDEASEKAKMRYTVKDGVTHHDILIGDFTPSTMWSLPRWWRIQGNEHLAEPRYTTAHHIHGIWPDSKLIVILRDPVERAFSQMKYRSLPRDGQVAAHFHSLVLKTIKTLETCRPLRGCVYNRTDPELREMHGNFMIIPGLYAIFVADWLKVFPRDQFLFIRFEDYITDKVKELDRVTDFLHTAPLDPELHEKLSRQPPANAGIHTEPMWNKTRRMLQIFYKPWNTRLQQILGTGLFNWGY